MSMNISRRAFMKGAAASSLAVAASTMLTGCSLPNLDDIFGNIFGGQKGVLPSSAQPVVDVALMDATQDMHGNFVITVKLTNNASRTNYKLSPTATNYGIVPTLKNPDVKDAEYNYLPALSTVPDSGKDLIHGESIEWKMVFMPDTDNVLWNKLELSISMYDKDGAVTGEPVVFTYGGK